MRIVVGVDGSAESRSAVTWAAEEALRHGHEVELVHAEFVYHSSRTTGAWSREARGQIHADARTLLETAAEAVREAGAPVTMYSTPGDGVGVLLDRAEGAAMLVVGGRGGGGFRGMLLGSVAHGVAGRARCPVAVIRERVSLQGREIVVGVGDGDEAALRYALGEAEARGARLTAVRVWRPPHTAAPMGSPPYTEDVGVLQEEERRLLDDDVAKVMAGRSGPAVERRLVSGHPVRVLSDLSAAADLVVVGSRGRTGFALGSVSHGLIHHAAGPVVVVRTDEHTGSDS